MRIFNEETRGTVGIGWFYSTRLAVSDGFTYLSAAKSSLKYVRKVMNQTIFKISVRPKTSQKILSLHYKDQPLNVVSGSNAKQIHGTRKMKFCNIKYDGQ